MSTTVPVTEGDRALVLAVRDRDYRGDWREPDEKAAALVARVRADQADDDAKWLTAYAEQLLTRREGDTAHIDAFNKAVADALRLCATSIRRSVQEG